MTLASVGFDHTKAPFSLLEKVVVSADGLPSFLEQISASEHVCEAVVVSTCMRTEVYLDVLRFHGAVGDVFDAMAKSSGVPRDQLEEHSIERFDAQACGHLFRVAAGLESAVVGEHEVLGQVARAWEAARSVGTSRSSLNELFRHAVRAGKRARSETAIARGVTSIGQAAVAMAEAQLGALSERHVLVFGAGEMGQAMAASLSYGKRAGGVVVCNRTFDRAEELAARIGARASQFSSFDAELVNADVLLTSIGAPIDELRFTKLEDVMKRRNFAPLVIVDMGLPRDIDPSVEQIEGITLLDLEDLQRFTESGRNDRRQEVQAVEGIVEEIVEEYFRDVEVRSIAPLISDVYERAESIRLAEIARQQSRLGSFSDDQMKAVEAVTQAMVAKMLHEPITKVKASAGTPTGEHLSEALRLLLNK